MIYHGKLWGHAKFQKNSRFSLEGTQIILIPCSKSTTGRYREDQIRASHQEEERSKFLYIHFIHLKEIFHIFFNIFCRNFGGRPDGLIWHTSPLYVWACTAFRKIPWAYTWETAKQLGQRHLEEPLVTCSYRP